MYYQSEIWSNTSVLYEKHFWLVFGSMWRLETNSRLFYFFIKMAIKQDLTIFNSWHLPFFIVPYSPFQKDDTLESWYNLLFSNWSRFLKWKEPGTSSQSSKLLKRFLKIISLDYIYQLAKFGGLMSCDSKDIFKNAPCLM